MNTKVKAKSKRKSIPITYSKKPDIMALSSIWKNKNITLDELREKAWGKK
jgi:hypothetical protein